MSTHSTILVRPHGTPVASYTLATQLSPLQGLTGDRFPVIDRMRWIDGVGYGWPQSGAVDTWGESTTVTTGSRTVHTVAQSQRICQPSSWTTSIDEDAVAVAWLRRVNTGRAFGIRESYALSSASGTLRFTPNMGGAYLPSGAPTTTMVCSPNLFVRAEQEGGVTLLSGAVIPMEATTTIGDATTHALAAHMTQYYQIGINAGGDGVHQVDVWSYQPVWIEPTTGYANNLAIESGPYLTNKFDSGEFYDISNGNASSVYLGSSNTYSDASTSSVTRYINDAQSGVTDTAFSSNYGAVIFRSSTNSNFCVAVAAKLFASSVGLTQPTVIRAGQQIAGVGTGIDDDSGQFISVRSVSSQERKPGWILLRYFVVTETYSNVKNKLAQLKDSGAMDSTNDECGFTTMKSFRQRNSVHNLT